MSGAGWTKIHRQALENGWLRNHVLWAFWCYCLLKASHKVASVTVGYQRVTLEPGQFVFGRIQAAADLGLTERQARTCLTRLISSGNVSVHSTNKFSIISVINWGTYQKELDDSDQQTDQQTDQEATSNRPATDHKQEGKEGKEEEKREKSSGDKSPLPSALADLWNQIVKEPRVMKVTKAREGKIRGRLKERDLGGWAEVFRIIARAPFLRGENDRGWRADFDWVIANDNNAVKVLEGRYTGKDASVGATGQAGLPFSASTVTAEESAKFNQVRARFAPPQEQEIHGI
ncbi:hypothetical protein GMST_32800 [Geomonas silvestris]|uniref:Bacteriophage lambda Replication protein O N-terminal domain-containing protein n=1 Tax=Geomonas silvestris TaxID=2740184 RepID=A0A6V8MLN5_9BACT|nr:hypothetical protein [Geomonas silvestris]GFO60955.1 hypothetical protein GMST_32800 [Geomonas silvestris]